MKTNQPKDLSKIAQEINRLHGEVQGLDTKIENLQVQMDKTEDSRQAKATKIGQRLIEVKEQLPHGKFLKWVKDNCPEITERTAQQYMAFVRGDVETLMRGNPRSRAGSADLPQNGDLTDRQKQAIDLVKQGKSYKQIGRELNTDESVIRRDPVIRAVRSEHDPDAHSTTTRESWAACRTLSVDEHVESIEQSVEYLFDMDMYKIGKSHRNRLRKVADRIQKGLEDINGK